MNNGITLAWEAIQKNLDKPLLALPERQDRPDPALNKEVILKGKVVDRIGENVRIAILHPDGSLTGERVDLDSWEVSLIQKQEVYEEHQSTD